MSDRNTPERVIIPNLAAHEFGVEEDAILEVGKIACLNAAGFVVPGATATTLTALGIVQKAVDNTDGDDGDLLCKAKPGVFRLANGSASISADDKGSVCYIVDAETVHLTDGGGTRSQAGVIVDVDDDGVWVSIGFQFFTGPAATPSGTMQKKSVTVLFSDLIDPDDGDAQDVNVGTALPAGAMVVGARYTVNTPFAGAGLATLTMMVGKSGDTNGVIEAVDILGDAAAQYQGTLGTMMVNGPSLQSEVQLVANFDPDASAGLDELTAGSVTIDVYYFVAF